MLVVADVVPGVPDSVPVDTNVVPVVPVHVPLATDIEGIACLDGVVIFQPCNMTKF